MKKSFEILPLFSSPLAMTTIEEDTDELFSYSEFKDRKSLDFSVGKKFRSILAKFNEDRIIFKAPEFRIESIKMNLKPEQHKNHI